MKLWGGRFTKPTAPELEQLGSSIDFDRRLGSEDVRVNRVYARELHAVGILDAEELEAIQRGLDVVEQKLQEQPLLADEDIHTAVERLLGEVLGEDSTTAAKLPTGRSRNDLAVTEFRAYLASAIAALSEEIGKLQSTLVAKARIHKRTLLPGYTHMRRGQPVVFAQYLLAYFWSFERDKARLAAARERCRELAMGAGALAGNPFGIDRLRMAEELGLERVMPNSIDAVSSRDHILEFLSAAAILGTHFSRMSEDLILWSSAEFGFVSFDDAYATGSSIMPQKQNPDGCELVGSSAIWYPS